MRGIDHQLIRLAALRSQCGKDLVEHAKPAPADEPVVDRLVRAILARRVSPAQSIPGHDDGPALDPTIVNPRHSMRHREIRLDPAHLRLGQSDQITHDNASSALPLNQIIKPLRIPLIGPEPR